MKDLDSGNIIFDQHAIPFGTVNSNKRWYVHFGIDVWKETLSQHEEGAQEKRKKK